MGILGWDGIARMGKGEELLPWKLNALITDKNGSNDPRHS
jgi:hypothetical protein